MGYPLYFHTGLTCGPGLQKDRDPGTSGPKEALNSIGRFRLNWQMRSIFV